MLLSDANGNLLKERDHHAMISRNITRLYFVKDAYVPSSSNYLIGSSNLLALHRPSSSQEKKEPNKSTLSFLPTRLTLGLRQFSLHNVNNISKIILFLLYRFL